MNINNVRNRESVMRVTSIFLIGIFTIVLLTGCMGGEDYKAYVEAINKTESIQSGASKVAVVVESTLNESLLKSVEAENVEALRALERIEVNVENHFNRDQQQGIYDIFYYSNALGMDLKVYSKSPSEIYLKLPFMSELYDLGETLAAYSEEPELLSQFMKGVGLSWNSMLKAENIFVGEKTLITNEDGEVKSTKFTIKPTSAQLDTFIRELRAAILSNKETLMTYLKDSNVSDQDGPIVEADFEKFVDAIFNSMTITRYEETAYVDLDGYIIDERVTIALKYDSDASFTNIFDTQTITIHTTRWDIEREQDLDFSILENAEIKPLEKLNEWSVTP